MKKIILILTVLCGMIMASCSSCGSDTTDPVTVTEFVYQVTASAEGEGRFSWEALPHTGVVTLAGNVTVDATNDTTSVTVFGAAADALTLTAGLASEDPEVVAAAKEVERRLSTTHLEGDYKLRVTGFAKYGPMYFIIDEEYPKPAAE